MPGPAAALAQQAYHALCAWTLGSGDAGFVHQHVVDAFAAQCADERTKPLQLTFALVGLYLMLEKGYSGRQVQRAHMRMSRGKHAWPTIALPRDRGSITATNVLSAPAGAGREEAIRAWCASVWAAYRDSHSAIGELLKRHGVA